MRRLRSLQTTAVPVALAMALVVSACAAGDAGGVAGSGAEADAPAAVNSQGGLEADAPAVANPQEDPTGSTRSADAASGSSGDSEERPAQPTEDPGDAQSLLAMGSLELVGRAARGVATIELPGTEDEAVVELSSRFESDRDGDLSVRIDFEPGIDPQFPDGGRAEIRYVGRESYVRTMGAADAPEVVESSVGVDGFTSWFVVASESLSDPGLLDGIAGLSCVFPQSSVEVSWDCDPLSSVAALLASARGPSITGRETIRQAPTTKVAFRVPLTALYPQSLVDELEALLESGAVAADGDEFERLFELFNEGMPAEAWIDINRLARRLALDLSPVQFVFEFYDFDADISVDAPPPEQVAGEMPRFDGGGGAGSDSGGPEEPAGPPPEEQSGPGEDVPPPSELVEPSQAAPPGCPAPDGPGARYFDFDGPQPMCIDPGARYVAVFDTSEGEMRFELTAGQTPGTVNNFVTLARWGYYHHTLLFRTDPSIDIIQGGSPHTNSASDPGPGYTIPDEPAFEADPATGQPVGPYRYGPGQLVMARSAGFDSAGAQFFITTGPNAARLDSQGTYVVFGSTDAAGLAVAQSIIGLHVAGGSLGGAPSRPVKVRSVTIEETPVGRLPSDFTNAAICEAAGFTWSEESETCS